MKKQFYQQSLHKIKNQKKKLNEYTNTYTEMYKNLTQVLKSINNQKKRNKEIWFDPSYGKNKIQTNSFKKYFT